MVARVTLLMLATAVMAAVAAPQRLHCCLLPNDMLRDCQLSTVPVPCPRGLAVQV